MIKLVWNMGVPTQLGGFPINSLTFKTWLNLKMLINVDTPLIDLNRPPSLLITLVARLMLVFFQFNNLTLAICALFVVPSSAFVLPLIDHVINRQVDLFTLHNPACHLAKRHLNGLVSFFLLQQIKLAAFKKDSNDLIVG